MENTAFEVPDRAGQMRWQWSFHGLHIVASAGLLAALLAPATYGFAGTALALAIMVLTFVPGVLLGFRAVMELDERKSTMLAAQTAREQVEELFAMTDMLQSAEAHEDAGAVLRVTSLRLLPEFAGALYVFNNSRDRLDLVGTWNACEGYHAPEQLIAGNCWALKRGKAHINDPHARTLCCTHHREGLASIDVPMMARGAIHGLLVLTIPESEHSFTRLRDITRVSQAIADSMSLALSNIALREKLRTQSLRDPLTGLYNRRYMEDALERLIDLSERNGTPTSVVMIDLDNFKALNDVHGHAKGDAVLRDVAVQLVGSLRPSDVVSRYGGEELIVILPNCGLEDAAAKAEVLRSRIEALSGVYGFPVSASLGVACVPETSSSPVDIVPMADSALYAAKQAGKNCVRLSDRRGDREGANGPRLAVG